MLKFLGLLFIALVISVGIVVLGTFSKGTFLNDFLGVDFIQTYATIFGFNIAAIIFLLGQLFAIERGGQENFSGAKKEIKHNAYFLVISFGASIILLVLRPNFIENASRWGINAVYYIINIVILCLFVISIYAVFEILEAAFLVTKK